MSRFSRRVLTAIIGPAAITAALIGTATPALAAGSPNTYKDTAGAAATCNFTHPRSGYMTINCALADTGRDGDAVYIAFNSGYGGWRSVYNRNGANTTFRFTSTAYTDGARTWKWKVCRDRQAPWTDNCSATYSFTNPRI